MKVETKAVAGYAGRSGTEIHFDSSVGVAMRNGSVHRIKGVARAHCNQRFQITSVIAHTDEASTLSILGDQIVETVNLLSIKKLLEVVTCAKCREALIRKLER